MPRSKSTARTKVITGARAVPEWAQKVKSLREEAGNTQLDLQKAMKLKVNGMSLIETGRRQFTEEERKLFFELIGQPEDTSIPVKIIDLESSASKKAAKPAKPKSKKTATAKPAKPVRPAKAAKVGKAPKGSKVAPTALPVPSAKDVAPASPSIPAEPRPKRGRKPAALSASMAVPKPAEQVAAAAVPLRIKSASTRKPAEVVSQNTPQRQAGEPVVAIQSISPVKEAVLRDISRILSNPGLSDNHAKRLHGLFTSLAVNALLGE